jgi:superfamily II DNA or RNA helicase/SAM-dependent methyltransferase
MAKSKLEEECKQIPTLVIYPYSVRPHWREEIEKWYFKGENTKITELSAYSFNKKLNKAKDSDFVIINYDLLSRRNSKRGQKRIEALRDFGFQYIILDEVHNAKNPDALRCRSVKELVDKADHLALLSGTPIPNNITDLYMIMSFLDPKNYPIDFENTYQNMRNFYYLYRRDPHIVKVLLHSKMLRREAKDYIEAKLPKVQYETLEVKLKDEHARIYNEIYNNDNMAMYQKLVQLLKASLDPALVNPQYVNDLKLRRKLQHIDSCKYEKLDDIIEKETRNGKVLIFTSHFKKGVIDKLLKRYANYGITSVEGDVVDEEREQRRRQFQFNNDTKILVATLATMSEGVDLTAATSIVFLDKGYTPAGFDQGVRRSMRVGEIKKKHLKVYSLVSVNDYKTIDQGLEKLLNEKRRLIHFLLNGYALTEGELKDLSEKKVFKTRSIKSLIVSPRKRIFQHYLIMRNRGAAGIQRYIEQHSEDAAEIPEIYLMDWQNSLPGNAAKVCKQIIQGLESIISLERKVDLGCGPATLSRTLDEPMVNVDIDRYMLAKGQAISHPKNVFYQAPLHNLPLKSESFELGVCSLVYQMLALGTGRKQIRERELFLREANRILAPGGHLEIVLPASMVLPEDLPQYYHNLDELGFDVVEPLTGYIQSDKVGGDFRVFHFLLRKRENAKKDIEFEPEAFGFTMDDTSKKRKRTVKEKFMRRAHYGKFFINTPEGSVVPLEDKIKEYAKQMSTNGTLH